MRRMVRLGRKIWVVSMMVVVVAVVVVRDSRWMTVRMIGRRVLHRGLEELGFIVLVMVVMMMIVRRSLGNPVVGRFVAAVFVFFIVVVLVGMVVLGAFLALRNDAAQGQGSRRTRREQTSSVAFGTSRRSRCLQRGVVMAVVVVVGGSSRVRGSSRRHGGVGGNLVTKDASAQRREALVGLFCARTEGNEQRERSRDDKQGVVAKTTHTTSSKEWCRWTVVRDYEATCPIQAAGPDSKSTSRRVFKFGCYCADHTVETKGPTARYASPTGRRWRGVRDDLTRFELRRTDISRSRGHAHWRFRSMTSRRGVCRRVQFTLPRGGCDAPHFFHGCSFEASFFHVWQTKKSRR